MLLSNLIKKQKGDFLTKENLIKMCKDMIRREFEIIRIQYTLHSVFGGIDFYSKHSDDLLSIKHAVELATKSPVNEKKDVFYDAVMEMTGSLIFNSSCKAEHDLDVIKEKASLLVEAIFLASTKNDVQERKNEFVREIENYFFYKNIKSQNDSFKNDDNYVV